MNSVKISPFDAAIAGVVFITVLAVLLTIKAGLARYMTRLSSNKQLQFFCYFEQVIESTHYTFLIGISLLAAMAQLQLSVRQEKWLQYTWIIVLVLQVALWANRIITLSVRRSFEHHQIKNPTSGYGENGLQFEVVYFVLDPDYNKYMNIQQAVNLALMRQLRERGVAFAHPARTLYVTQTTDRAISSFAEVPRTNVAGKTVHL